MVKIVGDKLRKLRLEQFLTQEALAREAGVGVVTISRLERNQHEASFKTLKALAKALKVSPKELVED